MRSEYIAAEVMLPLLLSGSNLSAAAATAATTEKEQATKATIAAEGSFSSGCC